MTEALPCQIRGHLATPPELAIRAAMLAVEKFGADTLLTEAVILLGQAQAKVSEYVERPRLVSVYCDCTCADQCPNGKTGIEFRCSVMKLDPGK